MTHKELVGVAARWLRDKRRCGVVLTEKGTNEICDAIGWTDLRRFPRSIVVECKVSETDFKADQRKPHRRDPWWGLGMERWYLTPRGLLWEHVVSPSWPERWGLLELTESGRITARRVAPVVMPIEDGSAEEGFYRVAERALLLLELRKYQAQGITYRPLEPILDRRQHSREREEEVREARQLMGLEARA